MSSEEIKRLLDFSTLPEADNSGAQIGGGMGGSWRRAGPEELATVGDGEDVMIMRSGGQLKRVKYNKAKNKFFSEKEVVEAMTPGNPSGLPVTAGGLGGATIMPYTTKKVVEDEVDPSSVEAFATGPSALETARDAALRATPGAVVGTGAFIAGMGVGSAAVGGPQTPLGLAVGLTTGIASSMVASAALESVMTHGFKVTESEQEQIGRMLNPTAAAIGDFAPTLLMFRPSGSVLKAAAGIEVAGLSQKAALGVVAKGGLLNIGIAQASATADAMVYGNRQDPNLSNLDAMGRSLAFGDVNQEMGGGLGNIGDRLAHAGKELAIGGLALHKPWALGKPFHNAVHGRDQQVKYSGSHTEDALAQQRLNLQTNQQRARAIITEQAKKDAEFAEQVKDVPLTETEKTGVDQIKKALSDAFARKAISKETHDEAQRIADTLGSEMLENIQLRQIGGKGKRATVEGEAFEAPIIDKDGKATENFTNAVLIYAKAIERGNFTTTLTHEIAHPLFDSLRPEVRKKILRDLVREREKSRKSDRVFDEVLKFFDAKNDADWLNVAERKFSVVDQRALVEHLRKSGLKDSEIQDGFDRLFVTNQKDGSIRLRNELAGEDGKISRRLWSAREFLSVEFARLIKNRGKYDSQWGITDKSLTNFLTVVLQTMKRALLRDTRFSSATDDILDHIASGSLKEIMPVENKGVIPERASDPARQAKVDADVGSKPIDPESVTKKIGDILSSDEFKAKAEKQLQERRLKELTEEPKSGPFTPKDEEETPGRIAALFGSEGWLREQTKSGMPTEAAEGLNYDAADRDLARRNLSEGDAEPSLPETSKEALKKLGIKNTVIGNVVRHSKIGSIRSEFDKASTAGEVAHIFRNTSQATQESIQVLVTDKDGNPLEIYRHTLSEPGSSTLLPSVMISQALSVKGAKKVWVSHNHPSMTPQFSGSDLGTEMNIKTMFKGTGLTLEGFLAIAGDKYAFIGKESKGRDLDRQDIPGSRFPATGREIPIIERRFTLPRGEDTDVVSTTKGDTDVNQRMLVQELLGGKPGVIFLDRNDRAVGHQEVTAEQMAKLGTAGARNLLAGFSRSGGTSIVVHVGGDTVADALQIQAGENVANLGASVRGNGKGFIKNIIGTNPLVRTLDSKGSRVAGFKSEGDATAFDRGEPETRVGVGAIKPLHAAPKSNFPIMADKLKDFGFESGYLNQFSEHAIVGQLKTGVTQVRTAGDVAALIHDYSSTLAQGQTMILIIGADGKPIQVGLHMVDSSMNVEDKVVIKPMWGVLAGQAVSTPGAKEAWMVRINNDVIPGEVDASVQNELALKNLLEGSGINYRGLVAVAGRQYRSIEYTPGVQNKNGGHNQFDSTNVDWMPIDVRPATGTIPLTERRYSTRSQMPYDPGVTAPDRPIGAEDASWNLSPNESAKRLRKHLGGDPGVVFKTSSGKIVGTVHLTLDEMANIRNSPAQKTLLAMMDRAGVNWGMVSVGDAPNDPAAARATSNINAFLKQMGLKVTDTFHNKLGIVPGDPVGTSEYRWQSEGDAEAPQEWRQSEPDTEGTGVIETPKGEGGPWKVKPMTGVSSDKGDDGAYGRSVPTPLEKFESDIKANKGLFTDQEKSVFQLKSNNLIMLDRVTIGHILRARPGRGGKITDHRADFENFGIPLGDNINEQNKNLRDIVAQAFDSRVGIARIGEGFGQGIRTAQYEGSLDTYVTVLGKYRGKIIQMVFETTPQGNELRTAYPISSKASLEVQNHPTFLNLDNVRYRESRGVARSQAKAGAENPNKTIVGSAGRGTVEPAKPNLIDQTTKVQGTYGKEQAERKRGMLNNTVFSEGDAQEYNGRAEEAFKRDQIVGPEAIKGDFLAWMKSTKEMADQHLYQLPWPGNGERGTWEEDHAFNEGRKAQHATIDQVLAKLTKQKGFNPMTLKPGMLRQVVRSANEATLGAFKELTRVASNMHEFVLDQPADINMDTEWKNLQKWHASIIKQTQLGMEAGVISKASGLEIIEMTNDVRSRSFSAWYEYRKENGGDLNNFSEGDAENMRIPGGARDEAMKRRPARMNKTYLGIGHGGDHGVQYSADGPRPPFNPEKVFLYHYESETGKLTARNIAEMADSEGIEREDVKADSFVHGDQGELGIDTGVGIKRGGSGVNGRIEIDDDRGIIFVSAGSSRGELNNFRKGDAGQMRAEALSQVRKYVEAMQKKGQLPKGYKIEGYGFDQNRSVWENQERFSEGDAQDNRSFREPNHKDETLTKNGFITNYADGKFIRGAQRDQTVLELRREYGTRSKVFDPSVLKDGTYRLDITDKVTGREYGHITFSMESETSAYVVSTLVRGVHENKGVAKVMYAELGERLRRAGVTELTGMVVDEYVDPKTGKVIHRPINAREAVFGLGSTEVNHRYERNMHDDDVWMHADVRTKINPARRLSEGDAEPAMPPDTNPRTGGNELANHTNVQLAKRGFISNYAHSKLRSLAGMKIRIGLQTDGTKPTTPVTEGMELDLGKEENTFQGKVEYTGENGLIEIAQFTYVIKNHGDLEVVGNKVVYVPSDDYSSALDWIKIKPQFRGRDLSNVIIAEIAERLKRLKTESISAFVVDPEGRPIKAFQRIFGDENVVVDDYGFEETDGRDPFRQADHRSDTGFVRRTRDVEATIDPKKLYSEGDDAENMRIPGGARDEAMKRRPKPPIKTYLNIGHGDVQGEYGNARLMGNFKPEDTFLYTYNHGNGKFNLRNIADMAKEKGVEVKNADDFAHGMGGNLIENDLRLGRNSTGVSGRIELDHEGKKILVSAGQGRGKLDAWTAGAGNMMKRGDALKEVRDNVERLQKEGKLPKDYTVEGHGFPGPYERDFLGYKPEFQERFSEGDGENMRIPGGARDEFQRKTAGIKRQKPIKFWTDVGHAGRTDAEGEKNTFLWYSTKDGEIDVISADELRMLTDMDSDDIPTHLDWETHIDYGNIEGKHGKQPITSLPHGRIDDRGDVTRVSYLDHKNSGRTDYEFLRDEIKKKLAGFMLKQADEMPGYDFTNPEPGKPPERFSEGDSENMRIPGGARDEALKKREAALRQKRFRKEDLDLLYTDIGHPEGFGPSGKMDMAETTENQFLWSYDRYGQFHMQSVREAVDTYNEQRLNKYKKLIAEGESEEDVGWMKSPISDDEFTHNEWAKSLGLSSARELDYETGNGRLDITVDGKVRMSWVAKIKEVRERQMMAEQIKEEAASWLNSNKGSIKVPVTSKVKMPFRGTEADKIVGWNWGQGSDDATGRPRRFSEGDAENGRWDNQERAKGKVPNAKVSNGETDLGFVLDPGEELDSKGLRIRKNTTGKMFWGSIGHDPEFFMMDKAVIDALGKNLPDHFDASVGLFAFDSSTGRVKTTQERLFSTHLEWLAQSRLNYGDKEFGIIPENYSMMGRFEPAIIGTDGVVIRRGRISLARNVSGGNWVFDTADFSRSDIPVGAMAKIREAIAEESNAILDGKNRAKFEPAQDTAGDHYDVFGFGMAKEKEAMGFSAKDTGPIKLNEDAKTYRDLADRPIGEGKDGQARLLKIGRQLSEGDAVEETPFRIPKTAGNRTNMQLAKDIATARFFTGISTKAHDNAAEFPLSKTMKEIANLIHARAGAEAGVTGLDLPTAIMKERTKQMNRFFEIMDPLRSEFAAMDRDGREQAYQELADMVTGLRSIDSSTSAGRAAEGIKAMLKEMHDYRTAAGEKLGEVEDYFPAVYDSINISENAMAFKEDAKQAYMIELRDAFQGDALEAAAEKAARELTMSHIRGEGEGTFNDLFESDAPAMGENSSMKRKFGPESQRIMSKWQIKDPYRIISRYIAGATKRAELTRRLGDEGQQWRRMAQALEKEGVSYEKIDEMRDLLKASVGVGLRQNTRGEQTFIDLMGLYTAGSVMGRSFLNNMFEPASMGIRSGNLSLGLQAYGQTWARTIRNAARVLSGERIDKTFWEQYAEHVGTISADVNDAWMNSHSIEVDGDRSDPRINWLTSKVYQSNLLQITENAKLQASHAIGFKYLVGLAEMHQGKSFMNKFDVTESVRSNLRELGIPDADHTQFAQWMTRLNSLDDAGRMRMLTSGGKMSKMFETAITKFSLQSSVRSNRAHKPVFQDGPIGKTLFQLMSYSYSYAADVNSRTYSYARSALKSAPAGKSYTVGDRIRFMAPLMMVPLSIIAYRALFALKDELYPTEFSEKHKDDPAWTKWLNATSYAGAFGPKVEMATKYVMRDQPPGGPLGQTVVGAARAAKTAVVNAVEGKPQDNAIRQAKKASVSPIKAAAVIGATAAHPAAGTIASQVANSTAWSNAMTEADKTEAKKKTPERR